jgi:hypothetical protein
MILSQLVLLLENPQLFQEKRKQSICEFGSSTGARKRQCVLDVSNSLLGTVYRVEPSTVPVYHVEVPSIATALRLRCDLKLSCT